MEPQVFSWTGRAIVTGRFPVTADGDWYIPDGAINVLDFAQATDARTYCNARNSGETHEQAMKRIDRNRKNRARAAAQADAMRSIGMTKTRYGWE